MLSQGYSKEATAGALGISKATLYDWIERHLDFSDAIKEGESLSQRWWEDRGREACAEGSFNATVWVMTMKNRFAWTDRVEQTHTVTVSDELKARFREAIKGET